VKKIKPNTALSVSIRYYFNFLPLAVIRIFFKPIAIHGVVFCSLSYIKFSHCDIFTRDLDLTKNELHTIDKTSLLSIFMVFQR